MVLDITDFPDMEDQFCELVEKEFSKQAFVETAELMLGSKWKEDGAEIIREVNPKLMEIFERYI